MRVNTSSRAAKNPAPHRRLIALVICVGAVSTGWATDYSATAGVEARPTYNDNLRMAETDKTAVYKYMLTPNIKLDAKTETTTFELASIFYFNRYDKTEFNSDDQNVLFVFNHAFESSSVGLNANLVRESTITSEVLTTGLIGDTAQRTEQYVLSPSWIYELNDTNQFQLQGSYVSQDYASEQYTPYKNTSANFDWVHIATERLKLVASLTYSNYHSDDITFDVPRTDTIYPGIPFVIPQGYFGSESYSTRTKDKGAQLGVDYQWSEQSMIQARAGRSKSTTSYPLKGDDVVCADPFSQVFGAICDPEETTDQMSTAQLNWTWNNETQQFSLNGTKTTQPTSSGYTVDALRVGSSWSYKLTELDQIAATATLVRNRSKNASQVRNAAIADRDYQSASISYQRQFGQEWFVSTTYQFNRQKYTEVDFDANSNVYSVGIRYQPQAWHWAR